DRVRGSARHAADPSGGGPPVPRAVRPAGADPRHPVLPAPDVLAPVGELDPAGGVAGDRTGRLLRVWPPPQRHARGRSGDGTRSRTSGFRDYLRSGLGGTTA